MSFSLHPYNKVPLWKNPHGKSFSMDFPIIEANYSTEAELHNENIRIILNEMDDAQSKTTNVKAKMSEWYMHHHYTEFQWVCDKALNLAERNSPHKVDYKVNDCWGAIYRKGDWTKKHDHWPNVWSFVYYVDCSDDCSPLLFHEAPQGTHYVYPKIGKMVLFPSVLVHSVPKQTCDFDRIMVAGNIELSK